MGHASLQLLLNGLRGKYWIIRDRRTIQNVLKICSKYRRYDEANPFDVANGPLPVNKVRNAQVFEIIGIDYNGPLFLKMKRNVGFVYLPVLFIEQYIWNW